MYSIVNDIHMHKSVFSNSCHGAGEEVLTEVWHKCAHTCRKRQSSGFLLNFMQAELTGCVEPVQSVSALTGSVFVFVYLKFFQMFYALILKEK